MLEIELARTWHKVFALHLEYAVEGIESLEADPADIRDDHACSLGRWLAERQHEFAALQEFRQLLDTHHVFHGVAGDLAAMHLSGHLLAGRYRALEDELARFRAASAAVLAAIDALGKRLDAAGSTASVSGSVASPAFSSLWDDSLLLNIPVVDAQHRAIADLGDRVQGVGNVAAGSPEISALLDEFGRIVALHFRTEELLMRRIALPVDDLRHHRASHARILEEFAGLRRDIAAGTVVRAEDVIVWLRRWIIDHLLLEDMALREAYRASPPSADK